MTELTGGHASLATPRRGTPALLEHFTAEPVALPARGSARQWVESVTPHLTPMAACAVVEHQFGVLPLIETFFDRGDEALPAVVAGLKLGALGLFTPAPEHRWGAVMLTAEPIAGAWRVRGELRMPSPMSDGSIVLVRISETDHRLAWLGHHTPCVEWRGSRTGDPLRTDAPCWLVVEGAMIAPAHVSRPVALAAGAELHRQLDGYAGAWALVAIECARRAVRALRHAVRTARAPGRDTTFRASQRLAMHITEVEIETELAAAAARQHGAGVAPQAPAGAGTALALAAARTLTAVAAQAIEIRDQVGVAPDTPLADDGAAAMLTAHVGGVPMLEHELARARGLGDAAM